MSAYFFIEYNMSLHSQNGLFRIEESKNGFGLLRHIHVTATKG